MPPDRVHELACYSANLIALRVMLGGSVPLHQLLGIRNDGTLPQWRSTVMLWKAGLDADGLQSMLATVGLSRSPLSVGVNTGTLVEVFDSDNRRPVGTDEISLARLISEQYMEQRLRYGFAILDNYLAVYPDDVWMDKMASWLIPVIAGYDRNDIIADPPEGTPDDDISFTARLIFRYFRAAKADGRRDKNLIRLLFRLPAVFEFDRLVVAALAISYDNPFAEEFPELENAAVYGPYRELIRRARAFEEIRLDDEMLEAGFRELPDEAIKMIGSILKGGPAVLFSEIIDSRLPGLSSRGLAVGPASATP
jgi:hypothetical protein